MSSSKLISLKNMGLAMLILNIGIAGCNVNDKSSPADAMTDTSTAMKVDSSKAMSNATTTPDTTAMTGSTATMTADTMSATKGTAKPNAAKKGLKGKATITAPTKGTGAMEMDNTGVYSNVEYLPSFPGGNKGLQSFFDKNLEYPASATDDGVEGTVNVSFVVDENGKLTSPTVQGQNLGYGLEAEALRVVNKMPAWNPGKLKGKNVKTRFTLPIVFQLY